jgi:hypothetical protein
MAADNPNGVGPTHTVNGGHPDLWYVVNGD